MQISSGIKLYSHPGIGLHGDSPEGAEARLRREVTLETILRCDISAKILAKSLSVEHFSLIAT
jgi:hypothetical protein